MYYDRARLVGHRKERARAADVLSDDLELIDGLIRKAQELEEAVVSQRKYVECHRARDRLNGFEEQLRDLIHDTLLNARGAVELALADVGVRAPAAPGEQPGEAA